VRGHYGGIIDLAAVFPIRGIGLWVEIDYQ
jgi:hypothetical protein